MPVSETNSDRSTHAQNLLWNSLHLDGTDASEPRSKRELALASGGHPF